MATSGPSNEPENLPIASITDTIRKIHSALDRYLNIYYLEKSTPQAVKDFLDDIYEANGELRKQETPLIHILSRGQDNIRTHSEVLKEPLEILNELDRLIRESEQRESEQTESEQRESDQRESDQRESEQREFEQRESERMNPQTTRTRILLCSKSDTRGLWRELLAALIVALKLDPEKYIPTKIPPKNPQLRPYLSELKFPCEPPVRTNRHVPISSQRLVWLREPPVLHPTIKLLRLGSTRYYTRRATTSDVEVHIVYSNLQEEPPNQREVVLIFSSTGACEKYSARLDGSVGESSDPVHLFLFQQLITQILEDSLQYLSSIAAQIDKAKHNGIRRPRRTIIEFLILAEDCLRELPVLLKAAVTELQKLADTDTQRCGQDTAKPGTPHNKQKEKEGSAQLNAPNSVNTVTWDEKKHLEYLEKVSKDLRDEAKSVKETIISHIAVGQMERTRNLTILASIFIPLSFLTSFFAMPFDAVRNPNNNPRFPGLGLFFAIAAPLTLVTVIIPVFIGKIIQWWIDIGPKPVLPILILDLTMLSLMLSMELAWTSWGAASETLYSILEGIFVILYIIPIPAVVLFVVEENFQSLQKCWPWAVSGSSPWLRLPAPFPWSMFQTVALLDVAITVPMYYLYWRKTYARGTKYDSVNFIAIAIFFAYRIGRWLWRRFRVVRNSWHRVCVWFRNMSSMRKKRAE